MRRPLDDAGFILDAWNYAQHSKDPSTRVGCVIIRPDRTAASWGFNGFPRGVKDTVERYNDRQVKYAFVVHAEANAIATAREPLHGYSLFCTLAPCNECAKLIIQAGIKRVVAPKPDPVEVDQRGERWAMAHVYADIMFKEAGVRQDLIEDFVFPKYD